MLGLIEDLGWVRTMGFKNPWDAVILLGKTHPEMGGSEYYHEIHGLTGEIPPRADGVREKAALQTVMEAVRAGYVTAVHDCSKGGLAVALALMSIKGRFGVEVNLANVPRVNVARMDELLFSETHARFLLTSTWEDAKKILGIASKRNVIARLIGKVVGGDDFRFMNNGKLIVECSVDRMEKVWEEAIPKVMEVE